MLPADNPPQLHLLMVCLGNICRSPTAEGVMRKYIENKGMQGSIKVDSAGTGSWHIGENPDPRAVQAARARGYDIAALTARQVHREDFEHFDYIFAMDRNNLGALKEQGTPAHHPKLSLLLDHGGSAHDVVPDPYYSGKEGFDLVLDLIEDACQNLLHKLSDRHLSD